MTNYEAIKAMGMNELAGFLPASRHVVIVQLGTVMVTKYVQRLCWNGWLMNLMTIPLWNTLKGKRLISAMRML